MKRNGAVVSRLRPPPAQRAESRLLSLFPVTAWPPAPASRSSRVAAKVSERVQAAMTRYHGQLFEEDAPPDSVMLRSADEPRPPRLPMPGVIGPLPRRQLAERQVAARRTYRSTRVLDFKATTLRTFLRLFIWLWAATKFFSGNIVDALLRKSSQDRRAVRLRRVLEGMGPTFIKLGQQLSIRADILPFRYCQELTKMLDRVAPFPTEQAIVRIEAVAGRPIRDIFKVFDPEPIGSASIGCVYQAVLPSGEKVAVKVRRPHVGVRFAADLRALGWIMELAEGLAIIRPGMTHDLRLELKKMLFEELNYDLEARYTELFARRAKKKKQDYIQAPKVYFELSGEDVIVTEFVSGIFLWEILAVIDRKDENALKELTEKGIDPETIAKRMIRAFYWETLENIFFHADPHPANIVVRPDNSLVFIDFGSCGRFSSKVKRAYHRFQQCISAEDVGGMTESAMSMVEPLPPIDMQRFTREIESFFWDWLYATKSKHAEWWERCTGQMWMKFLSIARRYSVPMTLELLRMFRATFLYDSIAMRLHNDLDMNGEFKNYVRERGIRAKRKVRKNLRRRIDKGLGNTDYLAIERTARLGTQVLNRVQYLLDSPNHRFFDMLGKAAFAVSIVLRLLAIAAAFHILAILVMAAGMAFVHRPVNLTSIVTALVSSPFYQMTIAFALLVLLRKVLMRFQDIDIERK